MNDSGFQRQVKDLEHDFQNAMETMQFKFQDELKVKDEKIKDLENQLKDKNSFIVRLEVRVIKILFNDNLVLFDLFTSLDNYTELQRNSTRT